jgi:hypothetical protein
VRWCSFTTPTGAPRLGVLALDESDGGHRVLDVGAWARSRDAETPPDLADLVLASIATQERVADLVRSATGGSPGWVRPEEVRYLAPLRSAHALRSLVAWGAPPVLVHANRAALLAPDEPVTWPAYGEGLSACVEVAAVVGRAGRDLTADQAPAHVFGSVAVVSWTVVGVEGAKARVATSLGPWVATPDELDPAATTASLEVGGLGHTAATSRDWSLADLLAAASAGEDLLPTELVSSGALTPAVAVSRGSTVRAAVEGLGAVSTTTT